MPLYEYVCPLGHTMEKIGGLDASSAPCFCGGKAYRNQVNEIQVGTKEQKYRVSDFTEASAEIDHAYSAAEKQEGQPVKRPDLYKAGLAEARRRGAKVRT